MAKTIFWMSIGGIFYAYFGYPILLCLIARLKRKPAEEESRGPSHEPTVSIILPVYNEEQVIERKIRNTLSLDYPDGKMEIVIVSDGSADRTGEIVRNHVHLNENIHFLELPFRSGKAAALNAGLGQAGNEIVVFTDASIMLDRGAIRNVVSRFQETDIGCVSGEDSVEGNGGEGLYGRYELFLRAKESQVHSIVGASGSFYAQRRSLCTTFKEGMAPDFYSVLQTIEEGFRAVTEPSATGTMTSVKTMKDEFGRKERTIVRGMTTLFHKKSLLNPFRYGFFAFELLSHKVARWLAPVFMAAGFFSNLFLLDSGPYQAAFIPQAAFYSAALLSLAGAGCAGRHTFLKISGYLFVSNAAVLTAWFKYLGGARMEVWSPSKRETR